MSVNDPIADMLTRVRNALSAGHSVVSMPSTKLKIEVSRILKEEGYIDSFEVVEATIDGVNFFSKNGKNE